MKARNAPATKIAGCRLSAPADELIDGVAGAELHWTSDVWVHALATPCSQVDAAVQDPQGAFPEEDHVDPATHGVTEPCCSAASTIRPKPSVSSLTYTVLPFVLVIAHSEAELRVDV